MAMHSIDCEQGGHVCNAGMDALDNMREEYWILIGVHINWIVKRNVSKQYSIYATVLGECTLDIGLSEKALGLCGIDVDLPVSLTIISKLIMK